MIPFSSILKKGKTVATEKIEKWFQGIGEWRGSEHKGVFLSVGIVLNPVMVADFLSV